MVLQIRLILFKRETEEKSNIHEISICSRRINDVNDVIEIVIISTE